MSLDIIIENERIVFVTNPRQYEHIGDGYNEETIAETLQGETIPIAQKYLETPFKIKKQPVYLAQQID